MRRLALLASLGLLWLAGCTGSGRVHVLPPMRSDLPPDQPLIATVPITEAYYWMGERGEVNVALAYQAKSLLGKPFDVQWLMSIVLDEAPAGSEKLYQVRDRAVRMAYTRGTEHRRGQSLHGTVVIESLRDGRLRGRFHLWMRQQQFVFLTGWTPEMNRAPLEIMVGEFEAVQDSLKGVRILTLTEADGMGRPPPGTPATRPTIRWLGPRPASEPAL